MLFKKIFLWFFRAIVNLWFDKLHKYYCEFTSDYFTRKYSMANHKIGYGLRINGQVFISHPDALVIGNNVHIGEGAFFFSKAGLIIGDNTHINRNVTISTTSHQYEGEKIPYDNTHIERQVTIGKNVWIGMNVSITSGVTIGEGAIIGMGSVIMKNVGAYQIVGQQTLRTLKERNIKSYLERSQAKDYGGINGLPLSKREIEFYKSTGIEKENQLFFVLSTGRSGSNAISQILSQNKHIECKHEVHPQLIRLSTEFAHGEKSFEQMQHELDNLYNTAGFMPKGIYGESDQKLGNLVEIISSIFPKAKFIWLIREPINNVISMYSRGWFSDKEFGIDSNRNSPNIYSSKVYSRFRLNGYKCGEFDINTWESMHPFERNCWYWTYWNKKIEAGFKKLDSNKRIIVKLENLKNDISKINSFLEVNDAEYLVKETNKADYKLINLKELEFDYQKILKNRCFGYWTYLQNTYGL